MSFIIDFLNRNSKSLLFLFLISISVFLIFRTQNYPRSVLFSRLFCIESSVSERYANARNFIDLKDQNIILQQENNELRKQNLFLKQNQRKGYELSQDTINKVQTYKTTPAEIVNSLQRNQNNYYTINVGNRLGIQEGDGVITNSGVIGHIAKADPEYSIVLSVLHPRTKIKSRIKNTDYFGILQWEGEDSRIMHLKNIDKYVNINLNDTVETYQSTIFPEGVPIGSIIRKRLDSRSGKWDLSIQLFQDMNDLHYVYIVNNIEKAKIDSIEIKSEKFDAE